MAPCRICEDLFRMDGLSRHATSLCLADKGYLRPSLWPRARRPQSMDLDRDSGFGLSVAPDRLRLLFPALQSLQLQALCIPPAQHARLSDDGRRRAHIAGV